MINVIENSEGGRVGDDPPAWFRRLAA